MLQLDKLKDFLPPVCKIAKVHVAGLAASLSCTWRSTRQRCCLPTVDLLKSCRKKLYLDTGKKAI